MSNPTGEKASSPHDTSGGRARYIRTLHRVSRNTNWRTGALVTFLIISICAGFYLWYSQHSNDAAPDSIPGYTYAILGTAFLLLAAVLYSIRRRSHKKRALGQLNSALHWHVFFAIIGLALIFMHSFGNFNLRTGTYALYGLIALVISGLVGRALDRLVPRLIAHEVQHALTAQGEDRIETISEKVEAIIAHNSEGLSRQPVQLTTRGSSFLQSDELEHGVQESFAIEEHERPPHTPWDLAYISLEATPQELSRVVGQRLIPDKHSPLTPPVAMMPGAEAHIAELRKVQHAMQREQFYRYIIRYWRLFHIALALLTLGLLTWHLVYAAQLLLH